MTQYPPGYGAPPPPGYPPQQPGYPAQPTPQQQPMPPQQPVTQVQQPMALPELYMPDEAALAQAYDQSMANMGFSGTNYLKFPGPQGQEKWDASVHIGFESVLIVWICPPWAQGAPLFHTSRSHFWRSHSNPKGMSIVCPGEGCLVCAAAQFSSGQPDLQDQAKNYGRVRYKHLYNVIILGNPQAHLGQDGKMYPFVWEAGTMVHRQMKELIDLRGGASKIIDPMTGRPIRLKKKKTGPQQMDVEYTVGDLDPSPLPSEYYGVLHNLHDLYDLKPTPAEEDMAKAVADMGLMLGPAQYQVPQQQAWAPQQQPAYQPGAMPLYQNPYQQQMAAPPPPAPAPAPQQQAAPPAMMPPPVTTTGQAPAGYVPQTAPPPPPPPAPAPVPAPTQAAPPPPPPPPPVPTTNAPAANPALAQLQSDIAGK